MGLLSRLVVKCVRSTTSLAVTMDLALGQVILLLVVSSLVGANSETFKVSSTGAAARKQGPKMGDYVRTSRSPVNGHPVYEKTEGVKNFLYVSPNGFWTVGRTVGSTTSGLYNPQLPAPSTPPTSGWLYSDLPNGWKEDATLKVEKKPASSAGVAAVDQGLLGGVRFISLAPIAAVVPATRAATTTAAPTTTTTTATTTAAPAAVDQRLLGAFGILSPRAGVVPNTRALPTTAAPTTAAPTTTTAAPTTTTAPCAAKISVSIKNNLALDQNSDITQAANNFASTVTGRIDYRGVYTRGQNGPDRFGNDLWTTTKKIGTVTYTYTISRKFEQGVYQWRMTGGKILTKSAGGKNKEDWADPHLINDATDTCPPMSGWRFQTAKNTYSPKPDTQVIARPFP